MQALKGRIMFQTDFLVAKPSFLSGIARVLDIGSSLPTYNLSETPAEADAKAIRSDWGNVGKDLAHAIGVIEDEKE